MLFRLLRLAFIAAITALGQLPTESKSKPAIEAILSQFDHCPIVILGEIHGSIQFDRLLQELVATPSFSARVNDIVVEMANALYQPILDAYIAGENVPEERLRSVWQDQVGAPGGAPVPPYHGLFAAVREVNRKLPADRRIRILAGDPPINWMHVRGREDVAPFLSFRDEHFGSVVRYEILAKRRKALLIIGAGHVLRRDGKPGIIEQQILGSLSKAYVITAGSDVTRKYDDIDPRFATVTVPAPWVMPMKASWLGALPRWSDAPLPGYPSLRPSGTQTGTWEQAADAYLFLGPRDSLTTGGEQYDLNNTAYGADLRRRWKILFPNPPSSLPKDDGSIRPLLQRPPSSPPSAKPGTAAQ